MNSPAENPAAWKPCRFLRTKRMYIPALADGALGQDQDQDANDQSHYWCNKTLSALGRDDIPAHPPAPASPAALVTRPDPDDVDPSIHVPPPMILAPSLQPLPSVSGSTPAARAVDYLRISITDRCNERCLYCLPEQFQAWTPRENILTYEEILAIVEVAVQRGFKHFRVTGGEPLLRRDVTSFLRELVHRPRRRDRPALHQRHPPARARRRCSSPPACAASTSASMRSIPARYRAITHGDVAPVLAGIRHARALGFPSIKLNTVLIRHRNEQEIWPLVQFAASLQIPIRFIELMPVSLTEMLTAENFLPVGEVFSLLAQKDTLTPLDTKLGHGPASYYRLEKTGAIVGFIGALTNLHFCESCNKVRLTADGHLRPCLGHHGELDLKPALRPTLNPAQLNHLLDQALAEKTPGTRVPPQLAAPPDHDCHRRVMIESVILSEGERGVCFDMKILSSRSRRT